MAGTAPGAAASEPREDFDETDRIGWAWMTTTNRTPNITWHNGGTGGYRSFLGFDRGSGTGIIVLSDSANSVDKAIDLISEKVAGRAAERAAGQAMPGSRSARRRDRADDTDPRRRADRDVRPRLRSVDRGERDPSPPVARALLAGLAGALAILLLVRLIGPFGGWGDWFVWVWFAAVAVYAWTGYRAAAAWPGLPWRASGPGVPRGGGVRLGVAAAILLAVTGALVVPGILLG